MTIMSSLFPDFTNLFNVGKTISQNSNTDPNDVLNTKNALAQTGDYQVPDYGITDIPDMGMIDGLKKFQQKNGLKVDGVMKPGGPTESKIGETLAGQGVSTVDPLASNTSKPKPKPTKIDPLTGLPEIKMPKLKKPTNAMWGQAANQQNQNANPWFKSTKLQPVSDEAHAENARTMDGMLNYSENGFLPTLYADAVKNGGEKAIAEYANFLNQLSDRKKERVGGFEQEVMKQLPVNAQKAVLAYAQQEQADANRETPTSDATETTDAATAKRKPDESIEEFCAALPRLIQKSRDDLKGYQKTYDDSVERLKNLPGEIESKEHSLRMAVLSYAASVGKDALTLAWTSLLGVIVSAISAGAGAHDLKRQYEHINGLKNDLYKYKSDKKWAVGMIKSEKEHLNRMLTTQKEKCK
jgi:hypothetical protein